MRRWPVVPAASALSDKVFRLTLSAEPTAVRAALATIADCAPMRLLSVDQRATAEIVLAEVLNNIGEHAYADRKGAISIILTPKAGGLNCQIADRGREMPGGTPPEGTLPTEELPEGGFGWYLIRSLTQDLSYERKDGQNLLRFLIPG